MNEILFTSTDTFLGRAIRYLTGDDCNHVALRFGSLVVHSNLKGVHVIPYEDIQHSVTHSVPMPYNVSPGKALDMRRSMYDFGSLLYLAVRYSAKKYLKLDTPKANLWAASGMYTCVEFVTYMVGGNEDSLLTPHQLYSKMSEGT